MDWKNRLQEKLQEILTEDEIRIAEPMSAHTTFHIGGPAALFVEPKTEEKIRLVLEIIQNEGVDYFVLGRGSDLLVSDRGYNGVIVSTAGLDKIAVEGEQIVAGAGVFLADLSKTAAEAKLMGLEFSCGIPGSVGGAIFMNAGAYESEISHVLSEALILESDGIVHWVPMEDLDLGYRHSNIEEKKRTILAGRFTLKKGNPEEINAKILDLTRRREEKQPLEYPSAGSTFKRPKGYFAGKLISDAGLCGYQRGGAQVSKKHCGFVINVDHATAEDVYGLIGDVQRIVKEKFGVELHPEVRMLGEF
jgi:UDP-N-acetylmuramate dehydrogenase